MQTKSEKEQLKKFKTKKTVIAERSLVNKQIELSQMSDWTDKGQPKSKSIIPRALKKLEDNKLSSQMDREGLANELHEYKKFSL